MSQDLKVETIEAPDKSLCNFFEERIAEFNIERWEVKERFPLVIKVSGEGDEILGGAAAKTFGLWLLIENIWVSEKLRGKNMGTKILQDLEAAAVQRGCKYALLDTLNFQARPFYEKFGYVNQWTQQNYPAEGCKHFMVKEL